MQAPTGRISGGDYKPYAGMVLRVKVAIYERDTAEPWWVSDTFARVIVSGFGTMVTEASVFSLGNSMKRVDDRSSSRASRTRFNNTSSKRIDTNCSSVLVRGDPVARNLYTKLAERSTCARLVRVLVRIL